MTKNIGDNNDNDNDDNERHNSHVATVQRMNERTQHITSAKQSEGTAQPENPT